MYRSHVLVCGGTGCTSSHSAEIIEALEKEIEAKGLQDEVKVIRTGCFGLCALGPIMVVYPEGSFYSEVKVEDVPEIVEEHLLKGRIVKHLLYEETKQTEDIKSINETNFYKKQKRVALRNCGVINPEDIEEYIAMDGYQALAKALTEMTPEDVINVVKESGLRGRGGGGFPTGLKWSVTAKNAADQKYVVCNADEGDPHAIVEAMTICGYATGATEGYIYVRAEYPIAVHRLEIAIKQA
ncbi:MAG: NAD(P)H-dependent oxidoreductase subunit E, partial [Clostridia bacterium]|nr:NAD(P)H-dependent oxidoreductase subunit E [Clostridia bacterium]